jgi:hypothetical protein
MEFVDHRALGAIEFVDAVTAARLAGNLVIEPEDEGVVIEPNRSALYVIRSAPGLTHHIDQFDAAPAAPAFAALGFTLAISDPTRRYLPRSARIELPRRAAPASNPESVLNPLVVRMYPAAAAAVSSGWAVLRVRVQSDVAPNPGLANALVVVTPSVAGIGAVTAVTDARGEALVAIPGVPPVLSAAAPPLLTREFNCALEIVLDRRVVTIAPQAARLADPESIARDRLAGAPEIVVEPQPAIALSAGRSRALTVAIHWP